MASSWGWSPAAAFSIDVDDAGEAWFRPTEGQWSFVMDPLRCFWSTSVDNPVAGKVEMRRWTTAVPGAGMCLRPSDMELPSGELSRCAVLVNEAGHHPDLPHIGMAVKSICEGWHISQVRLRRPGVTA